MEFTHWNSRNFFTLEFPFEIFSLGIFPPWNFLPFGILGVFNWNSLGMFGSSLNFPSKIPKKLPEFPKKSTTLGQSWGFSPSSQKSSLEFLEFPSQRIPCNSLSIPKPFPLHLGWEFSVDFFVDFPLGFSPDSHFSRWEFPVFQVEIPSFLGRNSWFSRREFPGILSLFPTRVRHRARDSSRGIRARKIPAAFFPKFRGGVFFPPPKFPFFRAEIPVFPMGHSRFSSGSASWTSCCARPRRPRAAATRRRCWSSS